MEETTDDIKGPGSVIKPHMVEQAQETYFFEQWNGSVICVTEREAWSVLNNRQQVVGLRMPPAKLIGVSNGAIYQQAVMEAQAMVKAGKSVEEAQVTMRKGWAEELEAARGHIKYPRNFDMIDNRGNPTDLNSLRRS